MASYSEIAAYALTAGSILGSFISPGHGPWYDKKNNYIEVSKECTPGIDDLLVDRDFGEIFTKIIQSGNRVKPGLGNHRFYMRESSRRSLWPIKFVTLIKKKGSGSSSRNGANNQHNNREDFYYVLCYSGINSDVSVAFLRKLFAADENTVKAIHLDTSGFEIKPVMVSLFAGSSRQNQVEAINHVREHFLNYEAPNQKYNTKIIISGIRGVGKTYTAGLVKKSIEESFPGFMNSSYVQLFYDFNPSAPGLDIQTEVLTKATKMSPVIIVINEIDHLYREVFQNNNDPQGRIPHTQSKTTFNAMLDAIANTKYVICIFTTEKAQDELDAMSVNYMETNENFQSFYRKGRVDFFINMTATGSTKVDTV